MVQPKALWVYFHLEISENALAVTITLFVAVSLEAHTQQAVVEQSNIAVVVMSHSQPAGLGIWSELF